MPDEAQAVYARARLVVSAEMHSVILALAAGTPALHPHFAQAGLKQWMLRDLGIEEWLFDQDAVPVERIAEAMVAVQAGPGDGPAGAWRGRRRRSAGARRRRWPWCGRRRSGHRDRAHRQAQAAVPRPLLSGDRRAGDRAARGGASPSSPPPSGWRTTSAAAATGRATGCPPSGASRTCSGSSRTAVREAVKQLNQKGLVRSSVGRGLFVARRTGTAVGASLDTVLHLEGGSLGDVQEARPPSRSARRARGLAARHRDDLAALRAPLEEMQRLRPHRTSCGERDRLPPGAGARLP